MSPLFGLSHAFLVILAASGSLKLLQPTATIDAMQAARLFRPAQRVLAGAVTRLIGVMEMSIAVWALLIGSPFGFAAGALLFVAFNLFLWRLARQDASAACGCLGMETVASNPIHRVVNWTAAVSLGASAISALTGWGRDSTIETLALRPGTVAAYWVAVAVLAWLIAALPALSGLRPPPEPRPT